LPSATFADALSVEDAYARTSVKTGAAFFVIENTGETADRLISAASDIAARVELHTHIAGDDGVMMMREVEDGFEIPAGGSHTLARGGDHVMFMGLEAPLQNGEEVELVLVFEQAGEMTITVIVDNDRAPEMDHAAHSGADHDGHDHDSHGHSGHKH